MTFLPETDAFNDGWTSQFGTTTREDLGKIVVRAPGNQIVKVSQEILTKGPVADITIEDIPLEDVIADLFEKH